MSGVALGLLLFLLIDVLGIVLLLRGAGASAQPAQEREAPPRREPSPQASAPAASSPAKRAPASSAGEAEEVVWRPVSLAPLTAGSEAEPAVDPLADLASEVDHWLVRTDGPSERVLRPVDAGESALASPEDLAHVEERLARLARERRRYEERVLAMETTLADLHADVRDQVRTAMERAAVLRQDLAAQRDQARELGFVEEGYRRLLEREPRS